MHRFVIPLLLAASLAAQPRQSTSISISALLTELKSTRNYQEVAISPDGKRVAWVEEEPVAAGESEKSAIYVMDWRTQGAPPRRISAGNGKGAFAEHSITWSPDSSRLA